MKTPLSNSRTNPFGSISKYFLIAALVCLMGSALFAYTSTWTWKSTAPQDSLWGTAANWTITGPGSGAPNFNDPAYIANTQAIVSASDALVGAVYVQAYATGTITGVAPVLNYIGGSNQFNNGKVWVGSGGSGYGGVVNQTNGYLWGNYSTNYNLNLMIASVASGYTNAVGTFSFGGTNTNIYPYYLGGTNGNVTIGTNVGENGMLLLHDIGQFFTYGTLVNGVPTSTTMGGSIVVAGSGANGGIGAISVTGHQMLIGTGTMVFGGVSSTGGTATLISTVDSTGLSSLWASSSVSLGTHAFFDLRVSGINFSGTVGKVFNAVGTAGVLSGMFSALNSGSTYGITEGSYLTVAGYKFKASYAGNNFKLTVNALPFSNPAKSGTCFQITQGGVYEGYCWTSGASGSAAVTIATTDPVTIKNCLIMGQGDLIGFLDWRATNVVVKNCTGYGYNTNITSGNTKGSFVDLPCIGSLDVENCYVEGCASGVRVNQVGGPGPITIKYNQFRNMDGRYCNGSGGYLTTNVPGGHAIQLLFCFGTPGVEIGWNEIINMPWTGAQDDDINIYNSSGSSVSPMRIHDNYIYGAWTTNPWTQGSGACGICMDGPTQTSATATAFVNIYNNQVVATANGGLGIAAGHDDVYYNNRAIGSGLLPDGSTAYGANVGLAGENYYSAPGAAFFNNTFTNNLVGWINKAGVRNDTSITGGVIDNNLTQWPAGGPTLMDEADEYLLWVQKLQINGFRVGPQALPTTN